MSKNMNVKAFSKATAKTNYELRGEDHVVQFGIGTQHREVSFQSRNSAFDFMRELDVYGKLKMSL